MHKHILILPFLFLSAFAPVPAAEPADANVVEIGRPLKARSWLTDLGEVPSAVVPYDSLAVSHTIPREGAFYRIDAEVAVSAYTYFFNVHGREATYMVGSAVNLAKLIHELGVVEEIQQRHKGKEFASGVADGVKGIGSGIANLVTKPGQSFRNVGRRLRQTGRSIERVVGTEDKVGKDESGRDRSHLGSGPAGQARRTLAYEFGVDVYTTNSVLQKALIDLAQMYAAGGFATWAIPYHIGAFDYMNPISGNDATEVRIRDYDPYELRRLVGEELEPVLRMNREDHYQPLNRFLMNPNYSPRNTAYIGHALLRLNGAGNLPLVVSELAAADTPEEADMLTLEMRLYELLDRNVEKVVDFAKFRDIFLGLGADNKLYAMFPGDTLRPWKETANAFAELMTEAGNMGMSGVEVWTVGDVHPALVENAAQYGVNIHQHVLKDKQFYQRTPAVQ